MRGEGGRGEGESSVRGGGVRSDSVGCRHGKGGGTTGNRQDPDKGEETENKREGGGDNALTTG